MRKVLNILTIDKDEKILRTKSKDIPLDEVVSDEFQQFLEDMKVTAMNAKMPKGWEPAGLAAIQVGVPKNVFIAVDIDTGQFKEYINPKVKPIGKGMSIDLEGCLSIPNATGNVIRPKKIKVTYYDRHGNLQTERLSGFNSKIVQHEYDHLLGILFTDKVLL